MAPIFSHCGFYLIFLNEAVAEFKIMQSQMVVHWAVFVHFELKKQSTNKLKHKQTKTPRQTKTQTQKRILSKVLIVEALTPFLDFESGT